MKLFLVTLAVGMIVAASCSQAAVTGGATTKDAPATRACAKLRDVVRDQAAGALEPDALKARLAAVYGDAQASGNPVIRARAVALFTDSVAIASGGSSSSLEADLAAMERACSG